MRNPADPPAARQGSAGPSLTRRHAMTWRWPLVQSARAATFFIPCEWPECQRKGSPRQCGTRFRFLCATHYAQSLRSHHARSARKILRRRLRLPARLALRRSLFGPAGLDGFPGNRLSFFGRQSGRPGMPAF